MTNPSDWESFFDGHAPVYMKNTFTQHSDAEVEFLVTLLRLPAGSRILDVGCGTGRHAVRLAKRGYRVTGIDLSAGMLAEARRAASEANVAVDWVQGNAASTSFECVFEAALSLCEGAFGLVDLSEEPVAHDSAILKNVFEALRPGGRFVLTALNGCEALRRYGQADVEDGHFDPLNMVEHSTMEWDTSNGRRSVIVGERSYVPSELKLLLEVSGFEVEHIWGATAGQWERRPLKLDEQELFVIARKPIAAT